MLRDVELPIFPEICVIHKMDKNLGVEPHELPFLMQSLIVRGWIWQMPAKYQHMAVQMLNAGVIADVKPEKEPEEVIDVKVVDHDNTTTVCYSSYGVDGNPIWVGDDTVEEDGDTELEEG